MPQLLDLLLALLLNLPFRCSQLPDIPFLLVYRASPRVRLAGMAAQLGRFLKSFTAEFAFELPAAVCCYTFLLYRILVFK